MIASWRRLVRAVRRGRLALVPLLAVLITAHLASAAHSAPFTVGHTGPYAGILAVCPPQHHVPQDAHAATHGDRLGSAHDAAHQAAPSPTHDHDGGEHIDHSVDRPRDPGAQDLDGPELPGLARTVAPAGTPRHSTAEQRAGPPGERTGDRSLLCVWRQ
ncbi:hypothetical protein ACIBI4_18615 [Streptomyces sp. NPDC050418]|uniref:hypothetical protein n=1 Tax=Streptomyces sp. NPDC050418 TaxID=3365612 RepID=UPI00379D83EA